MLLENLLRRFGRPNTSKVDNERWNISPRESPLQRLLKLELGVKPSRPIKENLCILCPLSEDHLRKKSFIGDREKKIVEMMAIHKKKEGLQ